LNNALLNKQFVPLRSGVSYAKKYKEGVLAVTQHNCLEKDININPIVEK